MLRLPLSRLSDFAKFTTDNRARNRLVVPTVNISRHDTYKIRENQEIGSATAYTHKRIGWCFELADSNTCAAPVSRCYDHYIKAVEVFR